MAAAMCTQHMIQLCSIHTILMRSFSLVSSVVNNVACLLQTGRCWIVLDSNPAGADLSGRASGVSDHVQSLIVSYSRGSSEQTQPTTH